MADTAEIKSCALSYGADLVGIAPISRFQNQPPEAHPSRISPDTRSVIVLGFRIPRGALRGPESATAWNTFSGGAGFSVAQESTYLVCRELERDGWEATPLVHLGAELRNRGVRVHPDKPEPNVIVDMEYAAHAAGLGEIGMGKFFLTPEFGPRQTFMAILTDAEFEPDPVFTGQICDGCAECLKACPSRAMDTDRVEEADLCDGLARWYSIHLESCAICKTGPVSRPYSPDGEPCRVGAACGRACVAHLEETDRLTTKYHNPFRESAPVEG